MIRALLIFSILLVPLVGESTEFEMISHPKTYRLLEAKKDFKRAITNYVFYQGNSTNKNSMSNTGKSIVFISTITGAIIGTAIITSYLRRDCSTKIEDEGFPCPWTLPLGAFIGVPIGASVGYGLSITFVKSRRNYAVSTKYEF